MDTSIYMQIEGHKGSRVGSDPAHQGWIPLTLATMGFSAVALMRPRSYGTGKDKDPGPAGMGALAVTKDVDSSTAFLYQACASGKVFGKVLVDYCTTRNGKVIRRYMRLTLTNAQIVRSKPHHGAQGKTPSEDHVIDTEKLTWVYNA